MAGGPPAHLKKQREKLIAAIESDDELKVEDESSTLPKGVQRNPRQGESLSKIARMGIPKPPDVNFPLPQQSLLAGTPQKRIEILVKSMRRGEFLCQMRSTNFFQIRGESTLICKDGASTTIHFGEIYTHQNCGIDGYTNVPTPGHAWTILGQKGVWQWHYIHPQCDMGPTPTFLLSLENYLMYCHLRMDMPLPISIFDDDADLRGWVGKTYQD